MHSLPHAAAVGLLSLLRTEGGSVGTSLSKTIVERHLRFHTSRVGGFLDPLNPHPGAFLKESHVIFYQHNHDPVASRLGPVQALKDLRQQQAASLACFAVFWLCAVLSLALVVLVLFMKRLVAEKAGHFVAE